MSNFTTQIPGKIQNQIKSQIKKEKQTNFLSKTTYLLLITSMLIGASGCNSKIKSIDQEAITPINALYSTAMKSFNNKKYSDAGLVFKKIFEQHPTSNEAPYSELLYAYAFYVNGDYDDAIDVFSNYLEYFPSHEYADYARYMIFMSHYSQIRDVSRDQKNTENALSAFHVMEHLNNKSTEYYRDASQKLLLIKDYLAEQQLKIAADNLMLNKPLGSINRLKDIIKTYPKTVHIPECVYRLIECYTVLGIDYEAAKYFSILRHNYPTSYWSKLSLFAFSHNVWFEKYRDRLNVSEAELQKVEELSRYLNLKSNTKKDGQKRLKAVIKENAGDK